LRAGTEVQHEDTKATKGHEGRKKEEVHRGDAEKGFRGIKY